MKRIPMVQEGEALVSETNPTMNNNHPKQAFVVRSLPSSSPLTTSENKKGKEPCCMEDLPPDLLSKILASLPKENVAVAARTCRSCCLGALKWARLEQGCPWHAKVCQAAAGTGCLAALKWARANGCPWDEYTCAYAAGYGQLKVLKWARANGCPWDEHTCAFAAKNGHLELLMWARENGCPWNWWTSFNAKKHGHLEVLGWANANGCW
ncbi:Ankyrin repeat domain-containing protein [Balamuthia mandrillaris]